MRRRNGPKITLELDCAEEPQTEKVGSYKFSYFLSFKQELSEKLPLVCGR